MLWQKVDKKWQDRLGKTSDGDVSWKAEQWPVPGGDPLEVRNCTRKGVELSKFCNTREAPRTSITLHLTCGYGNFSGLMGGSDHSASAHFLLGRCGTPYLLVPTEFTSWHATWWNNNSIGIEIDNIGGLRKEGSWMVSEYSNATTKDTYCTPDEKDLYLEKKFSGWQYWATLTEAQYKGLGLLIKALCFKHKIPRIILPEAHRYEAFDQKDPKVRQNYRGICTHVNIDPARRADIGPYIDWPKLIQYGGITEADCYNPPANVQDTWQDTAGGAPQVAPAKPAAAGGGGASSPSPSPATSTSTSTTPTATATATKKDAPLPAPVIVDNHTLKTSVGKHGGRICLSVKQPGDPMPVAPDTSKAPAAKAPGKRDDFIAACMNFIGAPYKAGSNKPADGIDGAGMIGIAMKRVGLFKSDDEVPADATHLSALWHLTSGDPKEAPEEILPGDLVWFGKGDHDNDPMQHPMVYLGGGRALGPVPDGTADKSVQVIAIAEVTEKFAGYMHVDDLGTETKHTEHPGDPPPPGEKLTGALLPPAPADQYDALKAVVERAKGKWEDAKGKINLVGVTNHHDRCLITPKPDDWNDTLYAAFLDDDGNKCVLPLRASLNPGTDSNKAETWQLWEGSWKFKLGAGEGVSKSLKPDGKVKGWLDETGMGSPRPLDPKVDPGTAVTPAQVKATGDDKAPKEKPPLEVPKPDKPPPPVDKPFVFDGASKKLSLKFGMRMMRALIDWELQDVGGQLQGCLYSNSGVVSPYTPRVKGVGFQEWPEITGMSIQPFKKTTVDGREYATWKSFGIQWGGTGATNCCNSQLAAIFAASKDGKLRIKKSDKVQVVDLVANEEADNIDGYPKVVGGVKHTVGFAEAFVTAWTQGFGCHLKYKDTKKSLFGDLNKANGPAFAMQYLGIGEALGTKKDEKVLSDIRIGDSGQWSAHNWLVGDVRYEVKLSGRNAPLYCDQSDFVKGEKPSLQDSDVNGGYKLSKDDCTWVELHEEEFQARVKAFLEAKSLDFDGDKDVASIKAVKVRVFSANAVQYGKYGTNCGKVYAKQDDGSWVEDDGQTQLSRLSLGISRGWTSFAKEDAWWFARWYDNAGGA